MGDSLKVARVLLAVLLMIGMIAVVSGGTAGAGERQTRPDRGSDTTHAHVHADGPGLGRREAGVPGGDITSTPITWSSSDYDGKVFTSDAPDIAPQVGLPTVHVIYLHPSDVASRFAQYAGFFQAAAREGSNRLTSSVGRGIRYDERFGADGVRYLDVTVVKSKNSKRSLESPKQWSLVKQEIDSKFTNKNKKYLVFVDALSPYCGQSQLYQDPKRTSANLNDGRTVSAIYRYKMDATANQGDWCGGAVLHELSHAFGAVQFSAPNQARGGHCNDYANDVLCGYDSAIPYDASKPMVYDYGNDDYWDPAADPASGSTQRLPWWAVNLNRFICPAEGCDYANSNPGY